MNEDKLSAIIDNEREWRKYLVKEVDEIKKGQASYANKVTTLETKFSFVGAVFGAISGLLMSLALKLFDHK